MSAHAVIGAPVGRPLQTDATANKTNRLMEFTLLDFIAEKKEIVFKTDANTVEIVLNRLLSLARLFIL